MNKDLKEYIKNKFLYVNLKNINNNDPKSSIIVEYKNSDDIFNLINVNDQITVSDINGNLQNIDPSNLSFKNSFFKLNDNINKISNINNNKIEFVDKNNNNNNMSFDEFNKNILSRHRKELIGGGNNVNTIDDIYKNFNDSYVNYQNGSGQMSDQNYNFNSRLENFESRISNDVVGLKNAFRGFTKFGTELVNYTNDIQKLVKDNLIITSNYKNVNEVKTFISKQGPLHKRFKEFEKLKLEKKGVFGGSKPDHAGIKKGKEVLDEWINFFTMYLVMKEMLTLKGEVLKPLVRKIYDYIKHWGGNKMHTIIIYLHHELCNHPVYYDLGRDFVKQCDREWQKNCEHTMLDTNMNENTKLAHFHTDHSCLRTCDIKHGFLTDNRQYCKDFNNKYRKKIPEHIQEENIVTGEDPQKVGEHLNQQAEESANILNDPHGIKVDPNIADNIPEVHAVPITTTSNQSPPPPYPGPN